MLKYRHPYLLNVPVSGIRLTSGRLKKAFDDNLSFLKGFDPDRMLYWYRVHAGRPAPGAPYACGDGHFENNLHGQTVGEFLMGAGTSLMWTEDPALRAEVRAVLDELTEYREPDGFLLPVDRETFRTKEYPNYTRAWLTFGLLDAGYAGEKDAFDLARGMGDAFNKSDVLPYVKDMNLGFQGILAQTRLYDSPAGIREDIATALKYYQEDWWLDQLIAGDHRAIYDHPGNHPHSTLLTSLEAYCDLYRVTGEEKYLLAVKSALKMYEDKWQHVGGGIAMCEQDEFYPGCYWLSRKHHYNELCSTNFWILLNQRMHRLEPDNAHYADEIENSLYNMLLAAQVGDRGFHYFNYLQQNKDWRYLDRATCCASLGTRLCGLTPQFLYMYDADTVYCDIYASSEAELPNGVSLRTETGLPDSGRVRITVTGADKPFTLKLRIPRWAAPDGRSYYEKYEGAAAGDVFEKDFPFTFRTSKYTGGEEIPRKERRAVEYGPLLYAVLGAPNPLTVRFDPERPEEWFTPLDGEKRTLRMKGDDIHTWMAYCDIHDEPFDVYPVVERP
ncbi:MAG: glycoside hydrolase family 127 protein [Clostridia bacterium]|nr:glycoside hydrolase family 127 protein [Clostridia bacterium]